jgi:hypothetical protein
MIEAYLIAARLNDWDQLGNVVSRLKELPHPTPAQ